MLAVPEVFQPRGPRKGRGVSELFPTHRVLVADPPWKFQDGLPGKTRGASKRYETMPTSQICARVGFEWPHLAPSSILFLWRVSAMQQDALDVVRAWGFEVKSELVWVKLTRTGKPWFAMGHYTRASHETCLIATHGRVKVRNRSIRSTFTARAPTDARGRYIHSAKPEVFYDIVEEMCGGPYVELFGRRRREGWTLIGNQPDARPPARPLTLFAEAS